MTYELLKQDRKDSNYCSKYIEEDKDDKRDVGSTAKKSIAK